MLMECCCFDLRFANSEVADVPVEIEVTCVDASYTVDLALFLEEVGGWSQNVCSVYPGLVETCGQYGGEQVVFNVWFSCPFFEVVKIGRELLLASVAFWIRPGQAESR